MTAAIAHEGFRRLVATLGEGAAPASPTHVDFLFEEELAARVTLHPNGRDVVVDAFACDISELGGDVHGAVMDTLLRLNALGLRGRFFSLGVDPRGFVAVTSRAPIAALDGTGLVELLDYVAGHARSVRALVSALAPAEAGQGFSLVQED